MTAALAPLIEQLDRSARRASPVARIAVEALAVVAGVKPAARFTATREHAALMHSVLSAVGLRCASFEPRPEEWGYRLATDEERLARSRSDVRVYYARSREALDAVMAAQERRDDDALGAALGYPPCCIAASAVLGRLPMTDMVRVARMDTDADYRLNIFLTEMGLGHGSPYYLASHFPCHLACRESIARAEEVRSVVGAEAPAFCDELTAVLHLPVLLRDERSPPPSRRHGNFGAVLHGLSTPSGVLYGGFRTLRPTDDLSDARLDQGNLLRATDEALEVRHTARDERVALLGRDRWHLVVF